MAIYTIKLDPLTIEATSKAEAIEHALEYFKQIETIAEHEITEEK